MSPDDHAKPKDDIAPTSQPKSVSEVAATFYAGLLCKLEAQVEGIRCGEDIEFLHDFRVSVRRIRSGLKLVGALPDPALARALTDFSLLSEWTSTARDLDVFMARQAKYQKRVSSELQAPLARFFVDVAARRSQIQSELVARLDSNTLNQALADFRRDLEQLPIPIQPAEQTLDEEFKHRIRQQYKQVKRSARQLLADSDTDKLHPLRIHFKKLRYLLEFFEPLMPPKLYGKLKKPFKRLQDQLGDFNDLTVHSSIVEASLKDKACAPDPATQWALAMLLGSLMQSRRTLETLCRASVREFLSKHNRALFDYFKPRRPPQEEA